MPELGAGVAIERSKGSLGAMKSGAAKKPPGPLARIEEHSQWLMLAQLPLKLLVSIPIAGFKVRDLLALGEGLTVPSAWPTTEDVPLEIGGVQLAWAEFEVVEQKMAIRLTRLA